MHQILWGQFERGRGALRALALVLCALEPAWAQPGVSPTSTRYELSEMVELDRAQSATEKQLKQANAYLADRRWTEAVDSLIRVAESAGNKLLPVTEHRLVGVRTYANLQFSLLPPEALALYRSRVDPQARRWYEEGLAQRDRQLLSNVVEQAFASSWGGAALAALAEIDLERGEHASARAAWEMLVPAAAPPGTAPTWLRYPDSNPDLGSIRARLVLTSILEGSRTRAREELEALARLHPSARGQLGGQDVEYVQALRSLSTASQQWTPPPAQRDWLTFAGSASRNHTAPQKLDAGSPLWQLPLPPTVPADKSILGVAGSRRRVAESAATPLSYHPLVAGDLVLVNNQEEILAVHATTGKPAWGMQTPVIYRNDRNEPLRRNDNPSDTLGAARFTMTVAEHTLYARMGSSITGPRRDPSSHEGSSQLVALDLAAEGRLLWRIAPEGGDWAFEGSPLVRDGRLYVLLRRNEIQPQLHLACYDASTGRSRWRQFLCAAETPARGMLHEVTHHLLTLVGDTLYINSGLGAVVAASARDGRLRWAALYPRVRQGDLGRAEPQLQRDLTPCLYDRGRLLVAPADSRQILALDASTGQVLWQTAQDLDRVVHLLGVADNCLIASGDKVYWIGLDEDDAGRIKRVWPDGPDGPGYGRGLLAADALWWPTRDAIYVFDSSSGRARKRIELAPLGLMGGNLVPAADGLLIAGPDRLVALGPRGAQPEPPTLARE